jgi:hypothetical protein
MGGGVPEEGVVTLVRILTSEKADPLIRVLTDHGFIQDFDWMEWGKEANRFEDATQLNAADLQTCVKLLTTYARADRFMDGYLADKISSGQVARVLKRLRKLRG